MVDETPPPPAAPGSSDRRRSAPTIDLEATEIASRPMAGDPVAAESTPPEAAGAAGGPDPGPAPSRSGPAPDQADAGQDDAQSAASAPPSNGSRWTLAGGAILGALVALAGGAVALWVVGGSDDGALEARVGQLEHQVADIGARLPTDAAGAGVVRNLADRLAKLEARPAQVTPSAPSGGAPAGDPALEQRIATLETGLKALGERLDGVAQRADGAAKANAAAQADLARMDALRTQSSEASSATEANAAQVAGLAARVDALEAASKALTAQEKHDAENPDDHAVRTAIIAFSLLSLVERGRPFTAELKAAEAQASDPSALAPLEDFSAKGVPNPGILARELNELLPTLQRAVGTGHADAGFFEKLEANAERLVRIHPIEETQGDDPAAIISRVEFKAVHGDMPGALTELNNLPANVRAPAQAFIEKAQARVAALAAARAFAADALAALGKPSR